MASIDERIVSMVFENAKFEAGVAATMATLTKLDASLKNVGKTTGLSDIDKAASKVTLQGPMSALDKLRSRLGGAGQGAADGMSQIEAAGNKVTLQEPLNALDKVQSKVGQVGIGAADGFNEIEKASGRVSLQGLNAAMDSVTAKFSTMQAAASVALGNITSQAAMKGAAFGKSFALGPIQQGFGEYQTNLGSIQTILANTSDSGGNLKTVNSALGELNTYSDKTIYNFSEMAKNIGTFTAAGVRLKPATSAIKGIANLAALSGSNSGQASTAMYQLSQAIAAGRVGLQDWNSVVNAGMGGAVFQKSLIRTGQNMGTIAKGAVKIDKVTGKATVNGESFRESIMAKPGQKSWLSSEVLTNTLSQMTGDMTDAQLAAKGFNAEQIKAIQKQAKMAQDAATQVKTLPQVFDVARETIGSGWSQTFQTIMGDFGESKKTFTSLSNAVNGFINKNSKARNKVLKDWKAAGGRVSLIAGFKQAAKDIGKVLKPIHDAFREIFPAKTGGQLASMTRQLLALMQKLEPSKATIEGLRRTFAGLFAVLHIGVSIVKGVAGVIGRLLGVMGHGAGGFLNFTGSIGDFLVALDKALTKGGLLTKFFDGLFNVLRKPMQIFAQFTHIIANLFGGIDGSKAKGISDSMDKVQSAAGPLEKALHTLKSAWDGLVKIFKDAKNLVSPWLAEIGKQMSHVGDVIQKAFEGQNFDKIMSILQTGFIGGIFIVLKRAITGGVTELGGGLKGIKNVLGALTGNLQAMQQKVKAQIILLIAAAIATLAASAFILSKIPAKELSKAMLAIAIGLGELMGSMKLMTAGLGFTKSMAMIPVLAASMVIMATSLVILAGAMKIMATMSWSDLTKGLIGIGGGLAAMGLGMKFFGPGAIVQAPAILVLAVALNALAVAVKLFGSMKWGDLAKGIAGVFGALVAIAIPIAAIGPEILVAAPGLLLIAVAMNVLAVAVAAFGKMKISTLAKGIGGIAVALLLIGVAVAAIPPTVALQAAGLILLAAALSGIAVALAMFSGIGILGMVKGLIAMGASLLILGAGLYFMEGTLPGAAALLAAAVALAILAPTLGFMGTLKWGTIFKGLLAMVLVLGTLSVVGLVASEGLLALGGALLPLAVVLVVVAGAVFLFAKALQIMGGAGSKGVAVMVAAITGFALLLPNLVISIVKGLIESVGEIAKILPSVVDALDKVITTLIAFIIREAPKFGMAVGILIGQFLTVIQSKAPDLINAGFQLLVTFLTGLANNIGQVTTQVANIVTNFLNALTAKVPDLITAGANFLGAFLDGIASRIGGLAAKGISIVTHFIGGIASKIPEVMGLGVKVALGFLQGIANNVQQYVTKGITIILKFLDGIASKVPDVVRKGLHIARMFVHAVASGLVGLADVGAKAVIDFLNGLADVVRKRAPEMRKAALNLADAIIDGLTLGIKDKIKHPIKSVKDGLGAVVHVARNTIRSHSPSMVFHEIGADIMQGLANGISAGSTGAEKSMTTTGSQVVDAAKKTMGNVPNLLDGIMDTDPTIRPVLDLSQVKKDAGQIGDITKTAPIAASVSLGQASTIAQEKIVADQAQADAIAAARPPVHFEQNNYSPEALSTVEIYRRTNNQLSQMRKAVGL